MRYNLISYLVGDGIKNITKNKKSTFSAITIMLVTMLTVGICLVIGKNVNSILTNIESEYPLEIYLKDDITVSEKETLENNILPNTPIPIPNTKNIIVTSVNI